MGQWRARFHLLREICSNYKYARTHVMDQFFACASSNDSYGISRTDKQIGQISIVIQNTTDFMAFTFIWLLYGVYKSRGRSHGREEKYEDITICDTQKKEEFDKLVEEIRLHLERRTRGPRADVCTRISTLRLICEDNEQRQGMILNDEGRLCLIDERNPNDKRKNTGDGETEDDDEIAKKSSLNAKASVYFSHSCVFTQLSLPILPQGDEFEPPDKQTNAQTVPFDVGTNEMESEQPINGMQTPPHDTSWLSQKKKKKRKNKGKPKHKHEKITHSFGGPNNQLPSVFSLSCQIREESKDVYQMLRDETKRSKIINKCPWQHIPVFKRDNMRHNSWLTLTMEINLFRRTVIESISGSEFNLIPMLLYDDGKTCSIHNVCLVTINKAPRVDLGISFKRNGRGGVHVKGILVDGYSMRKQHQLIDPSHDCHCFDGFTSDIQDFRITCHGAYDPDNARLMQENARLIQERDQLVEFLKKCCSEPDFDDVHILRYS
eukprot:404430_1